MKQRPGPQDFAHRADDERVLRMIRLRRKDLTTAEVGARYGLSARAVRNATQAVLQADIKHSNDPEARIRAAYW